MLPAAAERGDARSKYKLATFFSLLWSLMFNITRTNCCEFQFY